MENMCLKFFCSRTVIFDFSHPGTSKTEKVEYFGEKKKKKFTYTVENIFLHNSDTSMKLSKKFLEIYRS